MIERLAKLLTEANGDIEKANRQLTGRNKLKLKAKSENGAFQITSAIFEYKGVRYYTFKDHDEYKVERA